LLKIRDHASRKPWRCFTGHIDKKIHIALGRVFPTCHRPEKANIARPVAGGHLQDLIATLSKLLTGTHSFIIVSKVVDLTALSAHVLADPLASHTRINASRAGIAMANSATTRSSGIGLGTI
jgi:hypothetical protein